MLYPQNGDRIVTMDFMTSLHPMYNNVAKLLFGFPKVQWLYLIGEVDNSVRCSCQIFSRFITPKISKRWTFWTQCRMGVLRALTVKNLNFKNPRWRTATILKTVKSPHLLNHSTDFDEIWHDDAYWPLTTGRR